MRGISRMYLVGRLGTDPQIIPTKNGGTALCTFPVAVHRVTRVGDEFVEKTDWHKVKVFGAQAELCAKYLAKGRVVAVDGQLTYERYQDKQGIDRIAHRVLADRVSFLDAPKSKRDEGDASAPEVGEVTSSRVGVA